MTERVPIDYEKLAKIYETELRNVVTEEYDFIVLPFGSPRWVITDYRGWVYASSHSSLKFLGVQGGYNVLVSKDRGLTWELLINGYKWKYPANIKSFFPTRHGCYFFFIPPGYAAPGLYRVREEDTPLEVADRVPYKVFSLTSGEIRSMAESRDGTLYFVVDGVDPAVVYRSRDGGRTWEKVLEVTVGSTGRRFVWAGLDDWGSDNVWVVLEDGRIFWSGNYGDTWVEFPSFGTVDFGSPGMCYVNGGSGIAVNDGDSVYIIDWWDPNDPSKIRYLKLPNPQGPLSIQDYGSLKAYANPVQSDEYGNLWIAFSKGLVVYPAPYYYAVPVLVGRLWGSAVQGGLKLTVSHDGWVYLGISDVVVEDQVGVLGGLIRIRDKPGYWWKPPKWNILSFGVATLRDTTTVYDSRNVGNVMYAYDVRAFKEIILYVRNTHDAPVRVKAIITTNSTRDAWNIQVEWIDVPAGEGVELPIERKPYGYLMFIQAQALETPTTGSAYIYALARGE